MKSNRSCAVGIAIVLITAATSVAGTRADLSGDAVIDFQTAMDMPFMAVGNAGNAADDTGFGAVDYDYNIGKFEVTAGQYTEFLNAVAADDAYGLYDPDMWSNAYGCKIEQTGPSGSYAYSVAQDWADRPVNFVSWGDAARFANWLHNDQPTGTQDLTTTEDGSYFLNGAISEAELLPVSRETDARYVIPSEDEWYKAAYHANDGVTGHYFDYPTGSDVVPSNDLIASDPGNNATFYINDGDYTIGGPYYRTEAGDHENSDSPYGTFDMGGNVWEWNEFDWYGDGSGSGIRGGSFMYLRPGLLHASDRGYGNSGAGYARIGFRIAEVPEPTTMSLLSLGGVVLLRRRRGLENWL